VGSQHPRYRHLRRLVHLSITMSCVMVHSPSWEHSRMTSKPMKLKIILTVCSKQSTVGQSMPTSRPSYPTNSVMDTSSAKAKALPIRSTTYLTFMTHTLSQSTHDPHTFPLVVVIKCPHPRPRKHRILHRLSPFSPMIPTIPVLSSTLPWTARLLLCSSPPTISAWGVMMTT
jgi:hypothetical protein